MDVGCKADSQVRVASATRIRRESNGVVPAEIEDGSVGESQVRIGNQNEREKWRLPGEEVPRDLRQSTT